MAFIEMDFASGGGQAESKFKNVVDVYTSESDLVGEQVDIVLDEDNEYMVSSTFNGVADSSGYYHLKDKINLQTLGTFDITSQYPNASCDPITFNTFAYSPTKEGTPTPREMKIIRTVEIEKISSPATSRFYMALSDTPYIDTKIDVSMYNKVVVTVYCEKNKAWKETLKDSNGNVLWQRASESDISAITSGEIDISKVNEIGMSSDRIANNSNILHVTYTLSF